MSDMSTGSWNTRPIEDALNARIAELDGIFFEFWFNGEVFSTFEDAFEAMREEFPDMTIEESEKEARVLISEMPVER